MTRRKLAGSPANSLRQFALQVLLPRLDRIESVKPLRNSLARSSGEFCSLGLGALAGFEHRYQRG
jgi:hypothetical protein